MPLTSSFYERKIIKLEEKIEKMKQERIELCEKHSSQINQLKSDYSKLIKENKSLKNQLQKIKEPPKIHNEHGAGRKSKATTENVAEILQLRSERYSYSQIANILTENSGEYISKSTVAKIVADFS